MSDYPEEARNMTHDEILETDEYADIIKDDSDERDEYVELMQIIATSAAFARMFEDGHITFGEYVDLTDYLVEWESDLSISLL